MMKPSTPIPVYLEIGKKRTFAGAVQWPGWCRSGRDESAALQALFEYGPRYGRVVSGAKLGFRAPLTLPALSVRGRLGKVWRLRYGANWRSAGRAAACTGRHATSCGASPGTCSTTPGRSRTGWRDT